MPAVYEGRPWADVQMELDAAGISYTLCQTCAPRDFFKTDVRQPYVVRTRELHGVFEVTLAFAPKRSLSLAEDDEIRC